MYGGGSEHRLSRVERRARRRRRRRMAFGLAVLLGAGVALLVTLLARSGDPPGSVPRQSALPGPDVTREQSELAVCRDAAGLADRAIETAEASFVQWKLHVDAMTRLVDGEITHDRAGQLWAKSKVSSKEKAQAFRDADERYRGSEPGCTAPRGADGQRAQCVTRLDGAGKALTEARKALTQWERHMRDMDAEAAGELTPEQVTSRWVPLWRAGERQVPAYREAADEYHSITGCQL